MFSTKIKNSFEDFYNLKWLYYQNLYKGNPRNADSDNVFIEDLRFFDKIERWHDKCLMQEELDHPPQEILNCIITLANCFGRKFIEKWCETYLTPDKSLEALDDLRRTSRKNHRQIRGKKTPWQNPHKREWPNEKTNP